MSERAPPIARHHDTAVEFSPMTFASEVDHLTGSNDSISPTESDPKTKRAWHYCCRYHYVVVSPTENRDLVHHLTEPVWNPNINDRYSIIEIIEASMSSRRNPPTDYRQTRGRLVRAPLYLAEITKYLYSV
jgi:hypothetical protein